MAFAHARALAVMCGVAAGCSYPEFGFHDDASVATDSAVADVAADLDTAIVDSATSDTTEVDTTTADTAPEAASDTGPTCTSNLECACGEICSLGKCVPSTDCTKDSHFCPSGITCKCIAGRWDIDGTGSTASALVPAQPVTVTDNGADLILRNYSIHDTSGLVYAMRIKPANCTSGWHYRNITIQCVDFANLDADSSRALNISRRGDALGCRPPVAPELLLDRVNISTLDSYSAFEDLEFSKATLRKVTTDGSGIVIAAWGPGKIDQLVIDQSPDLYTELEGKITNVTVRSSPRFRWWRTSPTETRDTTWPLITITYDKASCPTGRALTNTAQVKEICLTT